MEKKMEFEMATGGSVGIYESESKLLVSPLVSAIVVP